MRTLPERVRPTIVYTHHSAPQISRLARASDLYDSLHRSLAGRVDHVITTSSHYAEFYRSPGGPPVRVVPWGVDKRQWTPLRGADRTGNPLRVPFVGQMRPYKGVDILLRALACQSEVELTLVGTGPCLQQYQTLAAALGAGNVSFLGRVSDERLYEEYGGSDVVVLPSVNRAEAFGLVLLEGMVAGCVPVASDLPDVRDLAGPTGVVVPPGHPAALRAALFGVARDPGRMRRLQARSRVFVEGLTWDRCVDDYQHVFDVAVENRQTRTSRSAQPGARVDALRGASRPGGRGLLDRGASVCVFGRVFGGPAIRARCVRGEKLSGKVAAAVSSTLVRRGGSGRRHFRRACQR